MTIVEDVNEAISGEKSLNDSFTVESSTNSEKYVKAGSVKYKTRLADRDKSTSNKSCIGGNCRRVCENEGCNALLSRSCKNKYALMPQPEFDLYDVSPFDKIRRDKWRSADIRRFCRSCFMDQSIIDFNTHSWVLEPDLDKNYTVTMIMAHGAGGSRASYITQARQMAKVHGIRCILMDLAGHGARWGEKCTIKNCVKAIKEVLDFYDIKPAKEQEARGLKTLFFGSSWSGYIGYVAMGELSDYFSGMVADTCVLNLTRPREIIKWAGISAVVMTMSNYSLMEFTKKKWTAHDLPYTDFIESQFGVGLFGKCNPLRSIINFKLEKHIPKIRCPILFLNSTADPDGFDQKCQQKILDMLVTKDHSKVANFQGGNHFFSHDLRYFDQWIQTVVDFSKADTTIRM